MALSAPKLPVKIISGDIDKTIAKINEIVQTNMGNQENRYYRYG